MLDQKSEVANIIEQQNFSPSESRDPYFDLIMSLNHLNPAPRNLPSTHLLLPYIPHYPHLNNAVTSECGACLFRVAIAISFYSRRHPTYGFRDHD